MAKPRRPNTTTLLLLESYDYVIVSFSGGKDSIACVLALLALGIPKDKIILDHQCVDGHPQDPSGDFMDWPVTPAYVLAFGLALGIRVRFQWREGGFRREMLRDNQTTGPVTFETLAGKIITLPPKSSGISTRLRFPQTSTDLNVRWCSAYLKIDTHARSINNDPGLRGKQILLVSGERREESPNRAAYAEFERHRTSCGFRRVDHWRICIDHSETQVWDALRTLEVNPHPCYWLGFSRCSCMTCIFGLPDQWATIRQIAPERVDTIAAYETQFKTTIHRKLSVIQQANRGTHHLDDASPDLIKLALGRSYPTELIHVPASTWKLPPGAFKHSGGPV